MTREEYENLRKNNNSAAKSRNKVLLVLVVLIVLSILFFIVLDTESINFSKAIKETFYNISVIFGRAEFISVSFQDAVKNALITVAMGVLCTLFSVIPAFLLGLLTAKNIGGSFWSTLINFILSIIRSIPTILIVMIVAATTGLGSVPAVVGIGIHSIAYLTKVFSEVFEEMDQGKIEALKATGASFWETVFRALWPTTAPTLVAWTFLRFEINFASALGVGAASGAGGIGYELNLAGNYLYDMQSVGAITYVILVTCFLVEILSIFVRRRLERA